MTAREWMQRNRPDDVSDEYIGGVMGCPSECPYLPGDLEVPEWCCCDDVTWTCAACWDRELPEVTE